MTIFKSIKTLVSTPIRCLGELGNDLSSLTDDRKDEVTFYEDKKDEEA